MKKVYEKQTTMPVDARTLYEWHMTDGAFERLVPPFENVRLKNKDFELKDGSKALLGIKAGPIELSWLAEHSEFVDGEKFVDTQVSGPFAYWKHSHEFIDKNGHAILKDKIEYELPLGAPTTFTMSCLVEEKLNKVFNYRHDVTYKDLELIANNKEKKSMKVLVTGATGLIGSSLIPFLKTQGHQVTKLTRGSSANGPSWNPQAGTLSKEELEGYDVIVNLSGENIASGRWTEEKKKKLVDSRLDSTRLLVDTIKQLDSPPSTFICASAVGYYGNTQDNEVHESSELGDGFLAELCDKWELEAMRAESNSTRVVLLRFGVVLSPNGGMLQKLMPPFMMGAGGRIGSGKQYMSWISIDDAVGIIGHAMQETSVSGPVNVVAPEPCTNQGFTKVLGKVIARPTIFPVPEFAANLAFGEMAEETMLASSRVIPKKLLDTGYRFRQPDLESALRHLLGKKEKMSA